MSNIELSFDRPWLLLLLIPCFAVILIPFFLLPKKRRVTFRKIAPVVLHLLVVTFLVLILSGLSFVKTTDDQAVILLVDLSDSTENVQSDILSHAEELLELIDENTPVGIVAFGYNQIYTVTLSEENRSLSVASVNAGATDIASALEYAATLIPSDQSGHLILLTDGQETDGDAESTSQYLASRGIRIDAVYFDTTRVSGNEMQISSLTAPDGVYVGDEISLETVVDSNTAGEAVLQLYDNDTLVSETPVSIQSGSNYFTLTTATESAGIHTYFLQLSSDTDTIAKNNEYYTHVDVAGESTILIISDRIKNAEMLTEILSAENSVTTVLPRYAPDTIIELCDYDEIILSNVDYDDLPNGYDKLLDEYVETYGRSLLVVGGSSTYMYGNMEGTLLEELMPVTFSLNEESTGNSVALMLVLDCSMSMSNTSTYLSVAKQGAIKCVEAMSDNDYIGVVSFNRSAYLKSGLIPATEENKSSLTRIISGLTTSQGTYYTEALNLACQELETSDAAVKHIIFLSDGQPSDSGYLQAVKNAAAKGISVSTIGLGYSSSILESMAEAANGRYYYVSTAKDLPDIMLSETEQVTVSSLIVGEFTPVIHTDSEITDFLGTDSLPSLGGYLGTTLKNDATAYLTTEDGNPVYASWTYGNGTVACFTSDLNGTWSSEWLSSEAGQTVIANIVKATVSDSHRDSSLSVTATVRGKTTDLTICTADPGTNTSVSILVSDGTDSVTYSMTQTEPGVYEGQISTSQAGTYELMILETDDSENVVDYLQSAVSVSYSGEYNAFTESKEAFLKALCSETGGDLYTDMEKLAKVKAFLTELSYSPMLVFAILSLLLMLADIAIRKLRWKDLRNYLLKLRVKKQ